MIDCLPSMLEAQFGPQQQTYTYTVGNGMNGEYFENLSYTRKEQWEQGRDILGHGF